MGRKPQRSGWKASTFDSRDLIAEATAHDTSIGSHFLEHDFEPRDQGWGSKNIPCCVSCSITAAMEVLYINLDKPTEFSELFHYYITRNGSDVLSAIGFRDGFKAIINHGISPIAYHPYPSSRDRPMLRQEAMIAPNPEAILEAKKFSIPFDVVINIFKYQELPLSVGIESWKAYLQADHPIVFSFWMTDAYMNITDVNPIHENIDNMKSSNGHAVLAIGYDDQINSILVKDSRGKSFGKEGCWWLNYSLVNSKLLLESWVVEGVTV